MALIQYLTAIRFGAGTLSELPEALAAAGITRPLIVSDPGLARSAPLAALRAFLAEAPLFADTPANPTEGAVLAALGLFRTAQCDGLVALGGGSPIDLAKGVALLATHPGPLADYAAIAGGVARITDAAVPVIAVPTTAGTGSEVGRAALLTLADGRKLGFISPHLIPRQAICDPDLTRDLPPGLTAATGMDALTHCIETFLSPRDNPPAEAIALDGAARAWRHLPDAVADGRNRDARREMMMAALEGGLTFQKGLGAVHGLSHALGGLAEPRLHHGTLNAVLLPAVLRFNAGAAPGKYARLRSVLDLPPETDLAAALTAFSARLGLPATLSAMGVPRAALDAAAAAAERDHSTPTNPRPVDAAAYRTLLDESF